jgi:O-antigen/teichoic acid export membrane protein
MGSVFASRSLSAGVGLLTSLVLGHWVSPEKMGSWNRASLLITYIPFLRLGVTHGLSREIPMATSQGAFDRRQILVSTSLWCGVALASACLLFLLIESLIAIITDRALLDWACRVALIVAAQQLIGAHYLSTYRGSSNFIMLSKIEVVNTCWGAGLLALVKFFDFAGLLIRVLFLELWTLVLQIVYCPIKAWPSWNAKAFRELVHVGFPIMLVTQIEWVLGTLDRIVLVHDAAALGYLTLALLVRKAFDALATSLAQVDFSKLAEMHGALAHPGDIRRFSNRSVVILFISSAVVGIVAWLGLPFLVQHLLPRYSPGLEAARWMCLYGMVWAPGFAGNIAKVVRRQKILYCSCFVNLAAFGLAWFSLSQSSPGADRLLLAVQSVLIGRACASLCTFLGTRRLSFEYLKTA